MLYEVIFTHRHELVEFRSQIHSALDLSLSLPEALDFGVVELSLLLHQSLNGGEHMKLPDYMFEFVGPENKQE